MRMTVFSVFVHYSTSCSSVTDPSRMNSKFCLHEGGILRCSLHITSLRAEEVTISVPAASAVPLVDQWEALGWVIESLFFLSLIKLFSF